MQQLAAQAPRVHRFWILSRIYMQYKRENRMLHVAFVGRSCQSLGILWHHLFETRSKDTKTSGDLLKTSLYRSMAAQSKKGSTYLTESGPQPSWLSL